MLRTTIPLCIYDKRSQMTQKPAEDVKEFFGDDPYDALRYLLCAANTYLGRLDSEAAHRAAEDSIIRDFQKNRDWTSYYRRMEHLEGATYNMEPAPVPRSRIRGR